LAARFGWRSSSRLLAAFLAPSCGAFGGLLSAFSGAGFCGRFFLAFFAGFFRAMTESFRGFALTVWR
jgi:hypothetical protein